MIEAQFKENAMPCFPFYSPRRLVKTKPLAKGLIKLMARAKA